MGALSRVLVANRGEIALRIIRACRERDLETVAVYSEIDAAAPHVRAAGRAVCLGPAPAAESYLRIDRILEAAHATGADAVHPGYGFLSESAAFAEACASSGLTFIGPPAHAIRLMGSKVAARELMERAGVPVVPGATPREQSDEGVLDAARRAGFPALVKAAAGGGGKGMRVLASERGTAELVAAARREALAAFGDGALYVERLIERPKHVEMQVFADARGNAIHLFERECSAQRRHQKIVEESPSPALSARVRDAMGSAAVAAARAVGYRGAGTVEFLLEGQGEDARFFFLEMNTRLQVEHPVTEAVTGCDLVHAQLAVAAGEPLPWTQAELSRRGHAIECRIYAEDPSNDFLPQAGRLLVYREPRGPGIRVDAGVVEGSEIPVHYDPLIAKLIAHAETRDGAIARAAAALHDFPVLGVRTNVPFLLRLLADAEFRAGRLHTGSIDERRASFLPEAADPPPAVRAALERVGQSHLIPELGISVPVPLTDPWQKLRGWR
ncbi:MAG TPA: acetyl-CoA carboxylase biotin carboxylase subunit [Vicinamibacterales bacterium]|nr:acetyl-CoA carboxylase biotin carboxylase subunit [Vicinamibacterales bacterium]